MKDQVLNILFASLHTLHTCIMIKTDIFSYDQNQETKLLHKQWATITKL